MIGKIPNGVEISEIRTRLQSIPVPQENAIPEQNCATWAMSAIQTLQENDAAAALALLHVLSLAGGCRNGKGEEGGKDECEVHVDGDGY
ncbi:hypothetical protein VE02_08799 [Pseudogymnoascus sp. 03VT05]|nr:hypothetical protein VE02_08799 [Pseudogymnoascus sp. 03VT05]